jgi:uncharacterized protein YciI
MFVVFLKFSIHKSRAGEFMAEHKAWLQRGFDEGVFMASGSLGQQGGGCILVHGLDAASLKQRLDADPFVVHGVVQADITEVALSKAEPRLDFLLAAAT